MSDEIIPPVETSAPAENSTDELKFRFLKVGDHVVIVINKPTDAITLNPEQLQRFADAINSVLPK